MTLPSGSSLIGKRGRGRTKGSLLGVYSCNRTLLQLDKRSREYRLMRQVRKDLTDHIGGRPSPVQRMLVERAVILSLRLAMLDQKIVDGTEFTQQDGHQYLAWSNSLVRTLTTLGVQPKPAPTPHRPPEPDYVQAARRRIWNAA